MIEFHIYYTGTDGPEKLAEVFGSIGAKNVRVFGLGDKTRANLDLDSAEQVAALQKAGFDPRAGYRPMVMR